MKRTGWDWLVDSNHFSAIIWYLVRFASQTQCYSGGKDCEDVHPNSREIQYHTQDLPCTKFLDLMIDIRNFESSHAIPVSFSIYQGEQPLLTPPFPQLI